MERNRSHCLLIYEARICRANPNFLWSEVTNLPPQLRRSGAIWCSVGDNIRAGPSYLPVLGYPALYQVSIGDRFHPGRRSRFHRPPVTVHRQEFCYDIDHRRGQGIPNTWPSQIPSTVFGGPDRTRIFGELLSLRPATQHEFQGLELCPVFPTLPPPKCYSVTLEPWADLSHSAL